jgi:hypothetical protein
MQRRTLADPLQVALVRLKRDLKNQGMTEAQIHEIIPDVPPGASDAVAAGGDVVADVNLTGDDRRDGGADAKDAGKDAAEPEVGGPGACTGTHVLGVLPLVPMGSYFSESMAIAGLDGDGVSDVVTANSGASLGSAGTVSVLLGAGGGKLAAHLDYPAGVGPIAVALGDVMRPIRATRPDGYLLGSYRIATAPWHLTFGEGDRILRPAATGSRGSRRSLARRPIEAQVGGINLGGGSNVRARHRNPLRLT